ncbi:MAG: 3,4-dihydroxy-2-butanone-4-phosphate synthase [Methanospirillum sp.]|nr:3,4-dihydroxy-2-butanone-4-phosphate synthase [Methanospirillum sp.]
MIEDALAALRDGRFILLYDFDNREGETDFAIRADAVTPAHIRQMRKDGGGLICCAVAHEAAERIGLPFAHSVLETAGVGVRDHVIPYDRLNRSSFSLWVNHASTFTGITDNDRATTINEIADHVRRALAGERTQFFDEFRLPGHVALLRGSDGLLARRCGQTELSLALAGMGGITPAIVVCEMLDDETGQALRKEDARAYGEAHGIPFLEGREVAARWPGTVTGVAAPAAR